MDMLNIARSASSSICSRLFSPEKASEAMAVLASMSCRITLRSSTILM